jgi:hypothetical protein
LLTPPLSFYSAQQVTTALSPLSPRWNAVKVTTLSPRVLLPNLIVISVLLVSIAQEMVHYPTQSIPL